MQPTPQELSDPTPLPRSASCLAFGPDGRTLAVGTLRGAVLRYEAREP